MTTATKTKPCKGAHAGKCTTTRLYTEDEARAVLIAAGWTFSQPTAEWFGPNDQRGRLSHVPDYCDPNPSPRGGGTEWFLSLPNRGGFLHIIGERAMSHGSVTA